MKVYSIILVMISIYNPAIGQIVTGGVSGYDIIDPTNIEKWVTNQKTEYQGAYHFGFSSLESYFLIIVDDDSCYAQLQYGEFMSSQDYKYYYLPFKKVRIEGNKFFSDYTNGEFVTYNWNNKKTNGLIVYNPWRRPEKVGLSDFGFYTSKVEIWFAGKFPYASYRFLTETELEKFSLQDLKIMRNEIYARYKFIFTQNGEMDKYFRNQKWYYPRNENVDICLTDLEKHNILLIQKIEKNKVE